MGLGVWEGSLEILPYLADMTFQFINVSLFLKIYSKFIACL